MLLLSRFHTDALLHEGPIRTRRRDSHVIRPAINSVGNSNWQGPIWFPLNYLIIEAIERYHHFYRNTLLVEFPTGWTALVIRLLENAGATICSRG